MESTDVRLFSKSDIPWDEIAFDVIRQTLEDYYEDRANALNHEFRAGDFGFQIKDLTFHPGIHGGTTGDKSF